MIRTCPALAVIVSMAPSVLVAQSTGNAAYGFELASSARALSLGNTFVAAEAGWETIFYNPALLGEADGAGISVLRYGANATTGAVAAVTSWSGGGLGVGVQVLQHASSGLDPADIAADEGQLFATGPFGASQVSASVGYGKEVMGFQVGVAAKVFEQRIRDASGGAVAADLGVARNVGPFTVEGYGRHLGPAVTIQGIERPLPARIGIGASMRRRMVGPLDVGGAAAVARQRDGEIVPSGGIEISYWPIRGRTFTGRFGLQRVPAGSGSPVSFGFGFTGDRLTVEYAFRRFEGVGSLHAVGFSWR